MREKQRIGVEVAEDGALVANLRKQVQQAHLELSQAREEIGHLKAEKRQRVRHASATGTAQAVGQPAHSPSPDDRFNRSEIIGTIRLMAANGEISWEAAKVAGKTFECLTAFPQNRAVGAQQEKPMTAEQTIRGGVEARMEVVNLTPHTVTLFRKSGERIDYPPSGEVARVDEIPGAEWGSGDSIYPFPVRSPSGYGEQRGLPPRVPEPTVDELAAPHGPPDRVYIVSLFFAERLRAEVERAKQEPFPAHGPGWWEAMMRRFRRDDVVSPGELVRDDSGQIIGCKNFVAAFP